MEKYSCFIVAIAIAVVVVIVVRKKNILKGEWFRKLLHLVCIGILGGAVFLFPTWKEAVLSMTILVVVGFPALKLLEKTDWFESFLAARRKGELAMSLIIVGVMFVIVDFVCEGILGSKLLVITSIYAWGPGDAVAALVGKKHGEHRLGRDKQKSLEGTAAMFITSFLCVVLLLYFYAGELSLQIVLSAIVTAIVASFSELFSKDGNDTIICPVSSMIALLFMLYITGNLKIMP